MCPLSLTSLRMITHTAKCNMVISGWVWSTVEDSHFFRKELASPKKANMIRIMVLAGVEHAKMLVRPSVTELIT